MGQSKRMDRPRCSKCRIETIPLSVRETKNYFYVEMKCLNCGHKYTSTSQSAVRMAVARKMTTYSNTLD